MTMVGRFRFKLGAKIAFACLILIFAPAGVAWSMGLYDRAVAASIGQNLDALAGEIEQKVRDGGSAVLQDSNWLTSVAQERGVTLRVLDERGTRIAMSDAGDIEGRLWRQSWLRMVADFFFGPEGPPDFAAFEATLGDEGGRAEVANAQRERRTMAMMRTSPHSTLQVFYRAVPIDGFTVYIAQPSRRSVRALYDFRFQILKATLALVVAALLMAVWLWWSVVKPIRQLQGDVRAHLVVGSHRRLAMDRKDEIGELSRDFDTLTQRLQGRLEHASQVAADFAHDLKNPLASVITTAELLEGDAPLPGERRARLAAVLADAGAHMERSIDAMLALARLDEQLPRESRGRVNLSELVHQEAVRLRESGALTIETVIANDVVVWGVAARLLDVVQNLNNNAALFARERLTLVVEREQAHAILVVEDDGPGVSAHNRDKIFHRFFTHRPPGAPAGTGLGLAIVRTVVTAHGGVVNLESPPDGGARFVVRLPLSKT